MRQIAAQQTEQYVWLDEFRTERLGRKLWRFGWGLLFVVAMTLLSEFGPRTLYRKMVDGPAGASEPAVHSVK